MSDGITDGYRMTQEAEEALEAKGWIRRPVGVVGALWEDPLEPGAMYLRGKAEEIQEERDRGVAEVMES